MILFPRINLGFSRSSRKYLTLSGRTAQDLSSGLSSACGASENFKVEKEKTDPVASPSSVEWMSENFVANLTSTVPQQTTLVADKNVQARHSAPQDNLSNLAGLDWFQADPFLDNDLYAPTNSRRDNNGYMFDDWNDFISSTGVQAFSQNNTTATQDQSIVFLEEMSQSNLFSSDRMSNDWI